MGKIDAISDSQTSIRPVARIKLEPGSEKPSRQN